MEFFEVLKTGIFMSDERDVRLILANNLGRLLKERDISARAFGRNLPTVSPRTIHHILTAQSAARIDTIQEIADEFDIQPWELLYPLCGKMK